MLRYVCTTNRNVLSYTTVVTMCVYVCVFVCTRTRGEGVCVLLSLIESGRRKTFTSVVVAVVDYYNTRPCIM